MAAIVNLHRRRPKCLQCGAGREPRTLLVEFSHYSRTSRADGIYLSKKNRSNELCFSLIKQVVTKIPQSLSLLASSGPPSGTSCECISRS